MAMTFYLIGALGIVAGLGWAALAIGLTLAGSTLFVPAGATTTAMLLAALPGLGIVFAGLLLLAVGRALRLLAAIARNTREPVRGFVNPPLPTAAPRPSSPPPPGPPSAEQRPVPPPRPADAPKPPSFMDFDVSRERR